MTQLDSLVVDNHPIMLDNSKVLCACAAEKSVCWESAWIYFKEHSRLCDSKLHLQLCRCLPTTISQFTSLQKVLNSTFLKPFVWIFQNLGDTCLSYGKVKEYEVKVNLHINHVNLISSSLSGIKTFLGHCFHGDGTDGTSGRSDLNFWPLKCNQWPSCIQVEVSIRFKETTFGAFLSRSVQTFGQTTWQHNVSAIASRPSQSCSPNQN